MPTIAALPPTALPRTLERAAITVAPAQGSSLSKALPSMIVAQRDETLVAVAQRLKMPVTILAAHNKVDVKSRVAKGQKVLLPRPLQVSYLGKPVTGDVASMMVGSTGVTAFRFLFEKQGGKVEWNAARQAVTARNATHEITLQVGSEHAIVNRKEVMMDLAAFLLSGRTMVPIRFFEKALHAKVEWEPATGRLFVAMAH
jgi:LysM repeat protein